jgi:hypothetical protein
MDDQTTARKQRKFNAVDIVILAIIVAAAGFFLTRYAIRPVDNDLGNEVATYPYTAVFDTIEVPNSRFEGKIKVGDVVYDRNSGGYMGKVKSIEVKPSVSYTTTAEGINIVTTTPNHSHLIVTIEGEDSGRPLVRGGLGIDRFNSALNKEHELHIGDAAFFLRLQSFELIGYVPGEGGLDQNAENDDS